MFFVRQGMGCPCKTIRSGREKEFRCLDFIKKIVSLQSFLRQTRLKAQDANVAQLVEQLICNQPVVGSSPFIGSRFRDIKTQAGVARREGSRAVKWNRL